LRQNKPKMRLAINLVLLAIAGVFVWVLISGIREPIQFVNEKNDREDAVVAKLTEVRTAQELYRSIKGEFAGDFNKLAMVLKTDSFKIVKVLGDPDDPNFTGQITYETYYSPAVDSIKSLGISVDSLKYVPFGGGAIFDIQADTITYQKSKVEVCEVGVKRKVFMGRYADKKYARYDKNYDPEKPLKFGNMNAPNLSGNWEN